MLLLNFAQTGVYRKDSLDFLKVKNEGKLKTFVFPLYWSTTILPMFGNCFNKILISNICFSDCFLKQIIKK